MQHLQKFYSPEPGNENKKNLQEQTKENDSIKDSDDVEESEKNKEKGGSKFEDALQQWANDDARDIEEDDSTPLRSGL